MLQILNHCLTCGESPTAEKDFCAGCAASLVQTLNPRSQPPDREFGLEIFSVASYEGCMARLIKMAKRQDLNYLPPEIRSLFRALMEFWAPEIINLRIDGVVAVPSGTLRSRRQTDLSLWLARELAAAARIPLVTDLIRHRPWSWLRPPPSQKKLSRVERRKIVDRRPFELDPQILQKLRRQKLRNLVLVDDVCTTGSTLYACRQLLLSAFARPRAAFVLARRASQGSRSSARL